MAEEVETGGVKRFVYQGNYSPRLSEEKKREIELAYIEAAERKKKERKTRAFIIAAAIVLVLILLAFIFI